jgi:hypothetical protein
MPTALLRFGQSLLIVAMFAACGGHWLILQSVAWGGMIVEYSHTDGLSLAVEKTFDGQHPCALCTQIQQGRDTEKKHEAQIVVKKIELFDHRVVAFVPAPVRPSEQTAPDVWSSARFEEPAPRPPRAA